MDKKTAKTNLARLFQEMYLVAAEATPENLNVINPEITKLHSEYLKFEGVINDGPSKYTPDRYDLARNDIVHLLSFLSISPDFDPEKIKDEYLYSSVKNFYEDDHTEIGRFYNSIGRGTDLWPKLREAIGYDQRGMCYEWVKSSFDVIASSGIFGELFAFQHANPVHYFIGGTTKSDTLVIPKHLFLEQINYLYANRISGSIDEVLIGKLDGTGRVILDGTADQRNLASDVEKEVVEGGFHGATDKVISSKLKKIYHNSERFLSFKFSL